MEKIINIFGDSIVCGAGDNEMGGWANRLNNYLEKEGNFKINNFGISGDTSNELREIFLAKNGEHNPEIILVAIGINDSLYINSKDHPFVSLEKFESNLREIIEQAKRFTEKVIFMGLAKIDEKKLMPIPWDSTLYYDDENVALYNSKIKEICEKNNLLFIEMQDVLGASDLEDGLHPNAKGHEKMFQRIKNFLVENKICKKYEGDN